MKDSEEIGLSDPTIATPDETLSEIERRYKHGNLIKRAIEELAGNIESSLHDALSEIYDILNVLTLGAEYGKYKKFKEMYAKIWYSHIFF